MADLRRAVSWLIGVGCLGAAAPGAGTDALLIQQTAPWGHDAWGPELAARGLTSDTADASAPQTVDLTPYSLVIVAGDQDDELLQALHDRQRDLVEWVGGGGIAIVSTARSAAGLIETRIPFGGRGLEIAGGTNEVVDPGHPAVDGVPPILTGGPVSESQLDDLPPGARALLIRPLRRGDPGRTAVGRWPPDRPRTRPRAGVGPRRGRRAHRRQPHRPRHRSRPLREGSGWRPGSGLRRRRLRRSSG